MLKAIVLILSVFITLPIWLYLLYKILVLVNATELMWFLYWIYFPVAFLAHIVTKLLED